MNSFRIVVASGIAVQVTKADVQKWDTHPCVPAPPYPASWWFTPEIFLGVTPRSLVYFVGTSLLLVQQSAAIGSLPAPANNYVEVLRICVERPTLADGSSSQRAPEPTNKNLFFILRHGLLPLCSTNSNPINGHNVYLPCMRARSSKLPNSCVGIDYHC